MFQYLKNLTIDLSELKKQVINIPEDQWKFWINPWGKIVKNYKQVYATGIVNIDYILNQLPTSLTVGPPVFLKYDPSAKLHPHSDWDNKSAILIGISANSEIIFWKNQIKNVVPYSYPILANLEETHSVENNTHDYRFLLKIPFKIAYQDVLKQVNYLF